MAVEMHDLPDVVLAGDGEAANDCLNCGAPVVGPFCPRCGEQHARNQILPLKAFARHFWDEFVGFDARLLRTLKLLLLKPGHLTREYVAGRGRRYIRPLRLYLIVSALFFLMTAIYQPYAFNPESFIIQAENQGQLENFSAELEAEFGITRELFIERFGRFFNSALSILFWLTLPLLALGLKLCYLKSGWYFHAHFIFAMHCAAFSFILTVLALPLDALSSVLYSIAVSVGGYGYILLAMKHVYAEPWSRTLIKYTLLLAGYFVLGMALMVLALKV